MPYVSSVGMLAMGIAMGLVAGLIVGGLVWFVMKPLARWRPLTLIILALLVAVVAIVDIGSTAWAVRNDGEDGRIIDGVHLFYAEAALALTIAVIGVNGWILTRKSRVPAVPR